MFEAREVAERRSEEAALVHGEQKTAEHDEVLRFACRWKRGSALSGFDD